MKLNELLKKPVKIIIENNISEDMIFDDETVSKFIDKIIKKLDDTNNENFLFVYVDKEQKLQAVITSSNLEKLANTIRNKEAKTVSDLKLHEEFPIQFKVSSSDLIQNVLDIFKREPTDVVIVTSEENQYLGKVKRSKLNEWFKIMLDTE